MAQRIRGFSELDLRIEMARLSFGITNATYNRMDELGIGKSDLARRIKSSRPHVTQVLDGDRNMTLETIAKLGLALGLAWTIGARPLAGVGDEGVTWVRREQKASGQRFKSSFPLVSDAESAEADAPAEASILAA